LVLQLCLPDLLLRTHQNFVLTAAGVGITVEVEMTAVAVGRMAVAEVGIEVVGQAVLVVVLLVVHFPG